MNVETEFSEKECEACKSEWQKLGCLKIKDISRFDKYGIVNEIVTNLVDGGHKYLMKYSNGTARFI